MNSTCSIGAAARLGQLIKQRPSIFGHAPAIVEHAAPSQRGVPIYGPAENHWPRLANATLLLRNDVEQFDLEHQYAVWPNRRTWRVPTCRPGSAARTVATCRRRASSAAPPIQPSITPRPGNSAGPPCCCELSNSVPFSSVPGSCIAPYRPASATAPSAARMTRYCSPLGVDCTPSRLAFCARNASASCLFLAAMFFIRAVAFCCISMREPLHRRCQLLVGPLRLLRPA